MKKKIFILTLTIVFLVSTTGLPISYHLCQMMQTKSLSECNMCKTEIERVESFCCSENDINNSLIIKSEKSTCCQEEFVYNKVEDEFVTNKSDINFYSSHEILTSTLLLNSYVIDFASEKTFYYDTSPPFLIDPDLHITNSVLLI